MLFKYSGQFLQVFVQGADLTEPVHLLMEAMQAPNTLKQQLHVFERFNVLFAEATLRRKQLLPGLPLQRLCLALRALDGRLAGASYREIAIALFGRDRIDKDWNAPGEHLKNRIRRAAQRGTALMQGGYRSLLK